MSAVVAACMPSCALLLPLYGKLGEQNTKEGGINELVWHCRTLVLTQRQKASEIFTDEDAAYAVLNAPCLTFIYAQEFIVHHFSELRYLPTVEEMLPLSWRPRLIMAREGKGLITEPFWLSVPLGVANRVSTTRSALGPTVLVQF